MATNFFCYPNRAETAVLSGGSWEEGLPVTNLQSRFLSQYARSTDTNPSSPVVEVDFGTARYVTALALVKHNFSLNAKIRLELFSDVTKSICVFDSDYQEAYPRWYSTKQLRWGQSNFWGGKAQQEDIEGSTQIYLMALSQFGYASQRVSARMARITILDPNNLDGFIQIGRLYLADDWTPAINCSWGATVGWVDPTVVDTSLDGTEYFEERAKFREVVFKLEFMSENEGVNRALRMARDRGVSKDILFIWDPANPKLMQQRSFVGRLEELSPLEFPNWSITSMAFKLKELV